MKVSDLEVEDTLYCIEKEISPEIMKLKYHQKYLLLCIGNEVVSLEIDKITDTAFYLKIVEDGTLGKV